MAEITLNFSPPPQTGIVALNVYESASPDGPWVKIDRTTAIGEAPNYINRYTTELATTGEDWFAITWEDDSAVETPKSTPVKGGSSEIMASLADINANLDGEIIQATPDNSAIVQISVARIIRGYLSRVFSNAILLSWNKPTNTPEIVREIAGKLIASQVYFNKAATQSLEVTDDNFAQRKYNEAMTLLRQILSGEIVIPDETYDLESGLSNLDFFPVDDTDRSFTKGLQLY